MIVGFKRLSNGFKLILCLLPLLFSNVFKEIDILSFHEERK